MINIFFTVFMVHSDVVLDAISDTTLFSNVKPGDAYVDV